MILKAKEQNRTLMTGNENRIELPKEIRDAVLAGYDVYITKSFRDGVVSAKIAFHKVKVAGVDKL